MTPATATQSSTGAHQAPLASQVPPVRRDLAFSLTASQRLPMVALLAQIAARKLVEGQ